MPIYVYTIDQANEWDSVVRSFASYDVYYLSGYVKAFQLHGDGVPMLFYYSDENVRGINVVMKRDVSDDEEIALKINRNTYFDFITPYGYGGWLIEGQGECSRLFCEYDNWCRNHRIVSEFVRYHPMLNTAEKSAGFYDIIALGNTISMDLKSPDHIWANFTSKNRNMVRKAQKLGVSIYHGQFPEIYKVFKKIYNLTMDADNARAYYYFGDDFYNSIQKDLFEESQIFWADFEGEIIAVSIMLSTNGFMNYHLSGSLREYQHLAPSNLLLYKAALWGCRNGYQTLHMGGGVGSTEDSLYKFKSAFNRKEKRQYSIGKKIYLVDMYEELSRIKGLDANGKFFPKYRSQC